MAFGYGIGFGYGYRSINSIISVVAWIALNGELTTLTDGTRELVNSEGTNITSTTGKGLYLTAGSNTITTMITGNVTELAYNYEGTVYYKALGNVTDYVVNPTTLQGTGVYSNFIFTTQVGGFTSEEKTAIEMTPNTFLYMVSGVITSDVMTTTDDIIGWLPTLEDGSLVWDMVPKTTEEELGAESVVEGSFEGTETEFTDAWSGVPSADWIWNGDGTVTHTTSARVNQTVTYAGGKDKIYKLVVDALSAGSSEMKLTFNGANVYTTDMQFSTTFENGSESAKYFAFGRNSGDDITFNSVSIKELISTEETKTQKYNITNYSKSVRENANGNSNTLQAISHKLDANGMPIAKANNMSLTSVASKQIILKAFYTDIYKNILLATVTIPTYSDTDDTHIIVTTSNYETVLVDNQYSHFYLEAGLYPNLITLTHSGTSGSRKSMSLYNGNDIHPCKTDFDTETAKIRIDFDGASYWDVSRLSNATDVLGYPNFQVFGQSSNNVFDRIYMKEHGHAIRFHDTGTNFNTVQSGYFESMNMDAIVSDKVTLGIDSRNMDDIVIEGTRFLNNDILNTNDGIQTILSSSSSNCSFPDTIINGNRINTNRFTNGTFGLTYEKVITGWSQDMSFDQPSRTITWVKETLDDIVIGSTIHVEGSGVEGAVGVNDGTYTVESFTDKTITIEEDALTTQGVGGYIWASITNNTLNADKGKFFTSGKFMIGENAIDLKVGSHEPLKPMVVTNNIMNGWIQTDVTHIGGYTRALGTAFVAHYSVDNVILEDNIWVDNTIGISIGGLRSGDVHSAKNWSIRKNLFIRLGSGNPYNIDQSLNRFAQTDTVEIEENIYIDTVGEEGHGTQMLGFDYPVGTSNTVKNNCFINSSGTPNDRYLTDDRTAEGTRVVDVANNYYYNGTSPTTNDTRIEYATADEALLGNMTFFTDVIKEAKTVTEIVKTTSSSPHYAVCNPQGVDVPLEGGAIDTPYSLKKVMASGEVCIYTDDGATQKEYTDSVERASSELVGDIYMGLPRQFGDVDGEVTLYEVHSGIITP